MTKLVKGIVLDKAAPAPKTRLTNGVKAKILLKCLTRLGLWCPEAEVLQAGGDRRWSEVVAPEELDRTIQALELSGDMPVLPRARTAQAKLIFLVESELGLRVSKPESDEAPVEFDLEDQETQVLLCALRRMGWCGVECEDPFDEE